MRRMVDVLRAADCTQAEIVERAHVAMTTLQKGGYMKAMLAMEICHICDWNPPRVSGHWAPVYRYGKGVNVPHPPAAGNLEYSRRWHRNHPNYVPPSRPKKPKPAGDLLSEAELKRVRRQAAKLTPAIFTMAGQLGLTTRP